MKDRIVASLAYAVGVVLIIMGLGGRGYMLAGGLVLVIMAAWAWRKS